MLQQPDTGHTMDGWNPKSDLGPMLIRIIHQSGTHIRGIEKGESILCVDSATADPLSPAQPIKLI
jgi:hypothetical protein